MAAYSKKKFEGSMAKHGYYEAAANVFFIQQGFGASSEIPYNRIGIMHVRDHVYNKPVPVDDIIVVAVTESNWDPLADGQRRGALLRIRLGNRPGHRARRKRRSSPRVEEACAECDDEIRENRQ